MTTTKMNARPEHRKQFNDMEWEAGQKKGPPNYYIGDVVEFHEMGFGVITEVSYDPRSSRPPSYLTGDVKGYPQYDKKAWHFEGDFKRLVGGSPLRNLPDVDVIKYTDDGKQKEQSHEGKMTLTGSSPDFWWTSELSAYGPDKARVQVSLRIGLDVIISELTRVRASLPFSETSSVL